MVKRAEAGDLGDGDHRRQRDRNTSARAEEPGDLPATLGERKRRHAIEDALQRRDGNDGAVSGSGLPSARPSIARAVVMLPPVNTASRLARSKRKPLSRKVRRVWSATAARASAEKRRCGIGHEALGQAHAAERQAARLLHPPLAEGEAFEATAAEVEDVEIAQVGERRIARKAAADQVGLLVARENAKRMSGGGVQAFAKLGAVDGVAHGARGDDGGLGRCERGRHGQQFRTAARPRVMPSSLRRGSARPKAGADAGVDRLGGQRLQPAVPAARGDQEL